MESNQVFLTTDPLLATNRPDNILGVQDPFALDRGIGISTNKVPTAPVGAPSTDLLTTNAGSAKTPDLGLLSTSAKEPEFNSSNNFVSNLSFEPNWDGINPPSRDSLTGAKRDRLSVGSLAEDPLINGTYNRSTSVQNFAIELQHSPTNSDSPEQHNYCVPPTDNSNRAVAICPGKTSEQDVVSSSDTLSILSSSTSDATVGNATVPAFEQYSTSSGFDESFDRLNDDQQTWEILEIFRQETIARWASLGIEQADLLSLKDVKLQLVDLTGDTLALQSGQAITIDPDAAGKGWFIDPSPDNDIEFSNIVSEGELRAGESDPARGHVDLLTVIAHEMGHVLGLHHLDSSNELDHLMSATLPTGMRRLPMVEDLTFTRSDNLLDEALDLSGNKLTLSSTSTRAALAFDGNDYVQVGSSASLVMTNYFTIEAWIRPTGEGIIVNKEGEYEIARFADGKIQWAIANSNPGWNWINTGYVAPANQWTHLAVTYDAGIVKTYANGTLVHTYTGSGSIGDFVTSQNDFRIGGRQSSAQYFTGTIDEVSVWNLARTETQIQQDMNRTLTGSESGLVGYWDFNEGSGNTASDKTVKGNNGSLGGGVAANQPVWTTSAAPLAPVNASDLTIVSATPSITASWGETVSISWTVKNSDTDPTLAEWFDKVYLSNNTTIDGGDTLLGTFSAATYAPMAAGAEYTFDKNFVIPDGAVPSQSWYLLVKTDADNSQGESNEGNNVQSVALNVSTGSIYRDTVLADAPMGYWLLDELTGTVAADSSGNSRNGSYFNGVTLEVSGSVEKAASFDGANDAIEIPINSPETNYTYELWFKTSIATGGISIVRDGGGSHDRLLYLKDGNIYHGIWSSETIGSSGKNYADDQWHHVAVVVQSGVGQKLYVDSELVASGSKGASDFNWDTRLVIGETLASGWGINARFNGSIDEVALYNSALSVDRIRTHYRAKSAVQSGAFPDLEVTNATVPAAVAWGQVPISWTVTNQSGAATSASWSDKVYLSTNTILDTGV